MRKSLASEQVRLAGHFPRPVERRSHCLQIPRSLVSALDDLGQFGWGSAFLVVYYLSHFVLIVVRMLSDMNIIKIALGVKLFRPTDHL